MTSFNQLTPEYLSESMSPSTVRRGAFRYLLPAHGFVYLSEDVMETKKRREAQRRYEQSEKGKKTHRRYLQSEKGRKANLKAIEKYNKKNPLSPRAIHKINNAIRDGRLARGLCEACGTNLNIHGHHEDYSKPLDVIWLCSKHHGELHRKEIRA